MAQIDNSDSDRRSGLAISLIAATIVFLIVRVIWAVGDPPEFRPLPIDLLIPGWWAVGLGTAVVVVTFVNWLAPPSLPAVVAGWSAVVLLMVAGVLFGLDVIGFVFELGIPFNVPGALSRGGTILVGVLLTMLVRDRHRRLRGACLKCGRALADQPPDRIESWGWVAAYLAMVGCAARVVAQLTISEVEIAYGANMGLILFELAFLAAGLLLPAALVHRFGRIWPGWVPILAGRRIPRWMVMWPGFVVGGFITCYFSVGIGKLAVDSVAGEFSGVEALFMWVSVSAYLLWGLGLVGASIARKRMDPVPCSSPVHA